jgi:cytochrome c peroxidase
MRKWITKRKRYHLLVGIAAIIFMVCMLFGYAGAKDSDPHPDSDLYPIELLGKYIYFDEISNPPRQGCCTCHNPKAGWRFGVAGTNKHNVAITGANPLTVGSLNPPSNAYAPQEPFGPCVDGVFGLCDGNFWNQRAEGNPFPLAAATPHVGLEVALDRIAADGTYKPALLAHVAKYEGPIADQAYNPFLNPVEQGNADVQAVCLQIKSSQYADLFEVAWGEPIDCSTDDYYDGAGFSAAEINHRRAAMSLAAWQMSIQVNSFSSKRDIALDNDSDGFFPLDYFTAQENLGHDLFYNRLPVPFAPRNIPVLVNGVQVFNNPPFPDLPLANCAFCHSNDPAGDVFKDPAELGTEPDQIYSEGASHSIGVPVNSEIPETFNAVGDFIDPDEGLAGHTGEIEAFVAPGLFALPLGYFKTPTLRNVCKGTGEGFTKAFTHNGYFKSVESLVHFYNTADVLDECPPGTSEKDALKKNCWPAAAYPLTFGIARGGPLVGNLGLTAEQEAAIVAYLHTLSDTYTPKAPKPYVSKRRR